MLDMSKFTTADHISVAIESLTGDHPPEATPLADLRFGDGDSQSVKAALIDFADMHFVIDISDDEAEACRTIGDLTALAERKSAARRSVMS